jgi:uncharacterized membrane protein
MMQKIHKIYPLQFEVIPLGLIILIIHMILNNYPGLPEIIPTHFNFQGLPDGWGSKSELFLYPVMSVFIYILITGISVAFAAATNPKNLINLPSRIKDQISPARAEKLRFQLIRFLFALKILVIGLDAYLLYGAIEVASNRSSGISYWPLIFAAAIIILVGLMLFQTFRTALKRD